MPKSNVFDEHKVKVLVEDTDTTIANIARQMKCRTTKIMEFIRKTYGEEYYQQRRSKLYRRSKLGSKNPMLGKYGEKHPNYRGLVEDGHGYYMILKPDWYTGRRGSKYVFAHSVVMCEYLGLTEVPSGFVIHHINGDRKDNNINNLALVSVSGHARLHSSEGATTSRKA
jgi:hypothetical protein